MHKYMPVTQKLNKPIVLLLALFCLNMGYCTLYKITSNNFTNKVELIKQPKFVASSSFASICSLNEATTKSSVSEVERSAGTDLRITELLTAIIPLIPGSRSIEPFKFSKISFRHIISPIPLFLQHRRLII